MAVRPFLSTGSRTALTIALAVVTAFTLRVALPYATVLGGSTVSFIESDAWYHMRLVDALIGHFPHRIWFDPYLHHPDGQIVNIGPFFDWIIAAAALVAGGGTPSPRLVDEVGAFVPPVIGALTVVPVYFITRETFSRSAALWAAAIVALLPGEILVRSMLGFTDHHCAEVLLSSLTMMGLVLAVRPGSTVARRLRYGSLAGLSFGAYLLTWSGGALLVTIIAMWAAAQIAANRLRDETSTDVVLPSVAALLIAGVMLVPFAAVLPYARLQLIGIGAGSIAIAVLHGFALTTRRLQRGRVLFLLMAIGALIIAAMSMAWWAPRMSSSIWLQIDRFSPSRIDAPAAEALPLMRSSERYPFPLWNQFTSCIGLAVVGAILAVRQRMFQAPRLLLLLWSASMLLATIGQVRFTYYLAVNVAILAGAGSAACTSVLFRRRDEDLGRRTRIAQAAVSVALLAAIVAPNVSRYRMLADDTAGMAMSSAWVDALHWLQFNTADPFEDPDAYASPADGFAVNAVNRRPSAYGVLSAWDKGYYLIRVAHRVPIATPKQTGLWEGAAILLASDESRAATLAAQFGARYVVVDSTVQARVVDNRALTGVFDNLIASIGEDWTRYVRVAFRQTANGRVPILLYKPAYYQTLVSRLLRSGDVERPSRTETWVVSLAEHATGRSTSWDVVAERRFPNYGAAEEYVRTANSANVIIVGLDPMVSCVPTEPLHRFSAVYRSIEAESAVGPPLVEIFELKSHAP